MADEGLIISAPEKESATTSTQKATAQLDSEIANIRSEIRKLTKHRHTLSSSLLASSSTQGLLKAHSTSGVEREIPPVALSADKHSQTNHHRIAFSATSFPFKDPSPHSESPNLLGIRIDVCTRSGKFDKPYYFLLKREGGDKKRLRIHRHTIPAFIPLKELEEKYLPISKQNSNDEEDGEGEEVLKPWKRSKQDLPRLVRELRRELVAWHLRRDAVQWLREELGLRREPEGDNDHGTEADENREDDSDRQHQPEGRLGIVSLAATSLETRYIRLVWSNGCVGRIKLSNRGRVERAIVLGKDGREKTQESVFLGGDGRIESLVHRLRAAEEAANPT